MKIAFGYKISSGKDTACEYLIKKYTGYNVKFSKYLYEILNHTQITCNFPLQKDREFLQFIGTWARNKDRNVWINLTLQDISKKDGNFFCSDVRFINEFTTLKKEGWIMIKIIRNIERLDNEVNKHESEIELDKIDDISWDYIIENNSNIEDFYSKIDVIVENLT